MYPAQETTSLILLDTPSVVRRLLSRVTRPEQPFTGRDSVDFIELTAYFHVGRLPFSGVPRTVEVYRELCAKFNGLMDALGNALSLAQIDCDVDTINISIHQTNVSKLYQQFNIDKSLTFDILIRRIAHSFQVAVASPLPVLQVLFISGLPIEIIGIVVSYLDNAALIALSTTCRGIRDICFHRLPSKAFFRMKYDMNILHQPESRTHESLRLAVIEAVVESRARAIESISDFASDTDRRHATTFVSFENEWDILWPTYIGRLMLIPNALDSHVFGPLYAHVADTLQHFPVVKHVRFVSLALSGAVVDRIAPNGNITHLTIERYASFPVLLSTPSYYYQMPYITYLAIGFHGDYFLHRHQWRLMTLLPNLRQVYAFAVDADVDETTVRFPYTYEALYQVHQLDVLHVQACTCFIDALVMWLECSSKHFGTPGRLRKLKLYSRMGIYCEDLINLIDVLGTHYPLLTTLIIDGVESTPAHLFIFIREHLPQLECLSLVRRATRGQRVAKLCDWEDTVYNYARAMHGFNNLRHLEVNMLWAPTALSPAAIAVLIAALYGYCQDEASDILLAASDLGTSTFCGGDVVALPFAAACPSLESFAIRAGSSFYSARIERGSTNAVSFVDVRSDAPHDRFGNWNPYNGTTWNV